MLRIGNHLPSSKGYLAMGKHAVKLGQQRFAFFTRNPRGGTAKPINEADVQAFLAYAKEHDIDRLVAHAPYTMNLCSAKPDIRQFGLNMLQDDMQRMEYTPGQYYNFHPGSHTGQGAETGISQIRRCTEPDADAGTDHHRPAGDYGWKGQAKWVRSFRGNSVKSWTV